MLPVEDGDRPSISKDRKVSFGMEELRRSKRVSNMRSSFPSSRDVKSKTPKSISIAKKGISQKKKKEHDLRRAVEYLRTKKSVDMLDTREASEFAIEFARECDLGYQNLSAQGPEPEYELNLLCSISKDRKLTSFGGNMRSALSSVDVKSKSPKSISISKEEPKKKKNHDRRGTVECCRRINKSVHMRETLNASEVALAYFNEKSLAAQGPEYELVKPLNYWTMPFPCVDHCNFTARPKNGRKSDKKLFFGELRIGDNVKRYCTFCCILGPAGIVTGLQGCRSCLSYPSKVGAIQHPPQGGFIRSRADIWGATDYYT